MSSSTTTSTSPSASSSSSSLSPGGGMTTDSFFYAIFTILIVLSVFCFGSMWRGIVIWQHRRRHGLPGGTNPTKLPSNVPPTIPVMHEVWLEKKLSSSATGAGMWNEIKPLSSSLSKVKREETISEKYRDPGIEIDMAAIQRTLEWHRSNTRRRQRPTEKGSSLPATTGKTVSREATPKKYRVATTVVVAMPSESSARVSMTTGERAANRQFPEVALGTCDTMM